LFWTLPPPSGKRRQSIQVPRVALDRIRREPALDGEMRKIGV